jgi:exodeoxyribonuclease VII small subunit
MAADARKKAGETAHADDPSFDARLARLEEIVGELEDGALELEPAIARYREGVELLRQCRGVLAGYRKQVEELSRDAEEALRPYAGDPDLPQRPGPERQGQGTP